MCRYLSLSMYALHYGFWDYFLYSSPILRKSLRQTMQDDKILSWFYSNSFEKYRYSILSSSTLTTQSIMFELSMCSTEDKFLTKMHRESNTSTKFYLIWGWKISECMYIKSWQRPISHRISEPQWKLMSSSMYKQVMMIRHWCCWLTLIIISVLKFLYYSRRTSCNRA